MFPQSYTHSALPLTNTHTHIHPHTHQLGHQLVRILSADSLVSPILRL